MSVVKQKNGAKYLFFDIKKEDLFKLFEDGLITGNDINILYANLKANDQKQLKIFENTIINYIEYLFELVSEEIQKENDEGIKYFLNLVIKLPENLFAKETIYEKYKTHLKENIGKINNLLIITEFYIPLFKFIKKEDEEFATETLSNNANWLASFDVYKFCDVRLIDNYIKILIDDYMFYLSKFYNDSSEFDDDDFIGNLFAIKSFSSFDATWYKKFSQLERKILDDPSRINISNYIMDLLVFYRLPKKALNSLPFIKILKAMCILEANDLMNKITNFIEALRKLREDSMIVSYYELFTNPITKDCVYKAEEIENFLNKHYYLYYVDSNIMNDELITQLENSAGIYALYLGGLENDENLIWNFNKKTFLENNLRDFLIENQPKWFELEGVPVKTIIKKLYGNAYVVDADGFCGNKIFDDKLFASCWGSLELTSFEIDIYKMLGNDKIYKDGSKCIDDGDYFRAISLFKLLPDYKDSNEKIKHCKNIINLKGNNGSLSKIKNGDLKKFKEQKRTFKGWKRDLEYAILMALFGGLPITVGVVILTNAPRSSFPVWIIAFIIAFVFEMVAIIYFIKAFKNKN